MKVSKDIGKFLVAAAASAVSISADPASAQQSAGTVTFNFTAVQTFNDANPTDAGTAYGGLALIAAGYSTITGSLTYDTATSPSTTGTNSALYPTGTIQIDQFDISGGNYWGPLAVDVTDGPGSNIYIANFGHAGSQVYDAVGLSLYSYSAALTSTNLPSTLALFDNNTINFSREDESYPYASEQTEFRIISIFSPTALPEPSTWAMMLLGFGAIGGAVRRSKRNRLPQLS